jgi:hypothetical protein
MLEATSQHNTFRFKLAIIVGFVQRAKKTGSTKIKTGKK